MSDVMVQCDREGVLLEQISATAPGRAKRVFDKLFGRHVEPPVVLSGQRLEDVFEGVRGVALEAPQGAVAEAANEVAFKLAGAVIDAATVHVIRPVYDGEPVQIAS